MKNQKTLTQTVDIRKATIEVYVGNQPYTIEQHGSWFFDEDVFPRILKTDANPEKILRNNMGFKFGTINPINDPKVHLKECEIQSYKILKEEPYMVEYTQKWEESFKKDFLMFIGYFTWFGNWSHSTKVGGVKTRGSDF